MIIKVAVVFIVSVALTWAVRSIARRRQWFEFPRSDRWHRAPVARFGGVALFGSIVVGIGLFVPVDRAVVGLVGLTAVMFATGLADDILRLRPYTKLVVQISAALALDYLGYHFNPALPYWIDLTLTVLWVVGITNAVNLLDNMDGLAAGVVAIGAAFRLGYFVDVGNSSSALMCVVLLAAALGFLVFNFSRASIFMGDAGSFVLGFLLAAAHLTTNTTQPQGLLAVLLFPVLVLALPIFDTTFVSAARWLAGRPIASGGTDHTSHRLVAVGLSERQAVLVLYGVSLAAGLAAFALHRYGLSYGAFWAALAVVGLVLLGILLGGVDVYAENAVPASVLESRPSFTLSAEIEFKRRALWVLVDVISIGLAYYGSYLLRFGGTDEWAIQFERLTQSAPIVVSAILVCLTVRGLYRSEWRYFSVHEVGIIVTGAVAGVVLSVLVVTYVYRFEGYSRSVFAATVVGVTGGLCATRLTLRTIADNLGFGRTQDSRRALLYGAGAGGRVAVEEIRRNASLNMVAVGFIDDDLALRRTLVKGLEVFGGIDDLEATAVRLEAGVLVVTTPTLTSERKKRLAEISESLGLPVSSILMIISDWDPRRADSLGRGDDDRG